MSYIAKLLGANEAILSRTRKHVLVLLGDLFKEILILAVLTVGFVAINQWESPQQQMFEIALGGIALIVIVFILIDFLRWKNEEFLVTNSRVIHSSGILSKRVIDSSLNKINDVILRQSWLGRILGYGTIHILTASEEGINLLDRISNPIGFKQAMLKAKAEAEPSMSMGALSASPVQLLEQLAQLKEKNLLSEEEYEEKRREILKRM